MTEACQHVADAHPSVLSLSKGRMLVILRRDGSAADPEGHRADWLDGAPDAAGLLCRPYPELMVCERTGEMWVRRAAPPS